MADVELDKHMNGQAIDNKIDGFEQQNQNLHDKTIENVENMIRTLTLPYKRHMRHQ